MISACTCLNYFRAAEASITPGLLLIRRLYSDGRRRKHFNVASTVFPGAVLSTARTTTHYTHHTCSYFCRDNNSVEQGTRIGGQRFRCRPGMAYRVGHCDLRCFCQYAKAAHQSPAPLLSLFLFHQRQQHRLLVGAVLQ